MKPRLSRELIEAHRNRSPSAIPRTSPLDQIVGRIGLGVTLLLLACGPRQQIDQPDLARPTTPADARTSDGGSADGSEQAPDLTGQNGRVNCIKKGTFEDRDQDDLCGECDPKDPNDGTRLPNGRKGPCDPCADHYSPLVTNSKTGVDEVSCPADGGKVIHCFIGSKQISCPIPAADLQMMQDMGLLDGRPADAGADGVPGDAGAPLDGGVSDSAADGRVDDFAVDGGG